jgi:hypothetical protein
MGFMGLWVYGFMDFMGFMGFPGFLAFSALGSVEEHAVCAVLFFLWSSGGIFFGVLGLTPAFSGCRKPKQSVGFWQSAARRC